MSISSLLSFPFTQKVFYDFSFTFMSLTLCFKEFLGFYEILT